MAISPWLDVLVQILIPIVAGLVVALLAYATAWLRARTASISAEVPRKMLDAALAEANRAAALAVRAVQQTLVDDWKAAASDGKLTAEERQIAMRRAIDVFTGSISAESRRILEATFGPAQEWVQSLLEAHVRQMKAEALASPK